MAERKYWKWVHSTEWNDKYMCTFKRRHGCAVENFSECVTASVWFGHPKRTRVTQWWAS